MSVCRLGVAMLRGGEGREGRGAGSSGAQRAAAERGHGWLICFGEGSLGLVWASEWAVRGAARELGQLLDERNAAEELPLFDTRSAQIALAGLGLGHQAAFAADEGPVANVQMIGDPNLPAQNDVLARRAAAGNAGLRADQVMPAD